MDIQRGGALSREAQPDREGKDLRHLTLTIVRNDRPLWRVAPPFENLDDARAEARRMCHGFARGQTSARWSLELRDETGELLPIETPGVV